MDTSTLVILALVALIYLYLRSKRRQSAASKVHSGAGGVPPSSAAPPPSNAEDTSTPEDFIASIPNYADLHIQMVERNFGVQLRYDEESFGQIDEIIEEGWGGNPPMMGNTILMFGSFVGESIRHLLGGRWAFSEEMGYHLAGVADTDMKVFPFAKVEKRFVNGEGDSIAFYYAATKQLAERGLESADE